jgi:GNAT superfamily N-acetyltransferase
MGATGIPSTGSRCQWSPEPVPHVTLSEITPELAPALLALRVAPGQERFVSGVAESLAEAEDEPEGKPWPRAILADGIPVGFVMMSWDVEPAGELRGPYFLWKLLIDSRYQREGHGAAALAVVVEEVRAAGGDTLLTSCVPGEGSPRPFYEALGFVPTGELDADGEVVLALDLTTGASR